MKAYLISIFFAGCIGLGFFIGNAFKPEWRDDKTQVSPYELAKTIERIRGCEDCEIHLYIWYREDAMISRRENWCLNANHNGHIIEAMGKKYPKVYEQYR